MENIFLTVLKIHYTECFLIGLLQQGKKNCCFCRTMIQDNRGKATEALKIIRAEVVKIQPRSPDLNPIENFLHNVKRTLRQDAITNRIVCENLNSFRTRILETIRTYDKNIINKTTSSMHKRLFRDH